MVDVFVSMALPTNRFEVVEVHCDFGIVDVVRIQLFDVMDNHRRSFYSFGKTVLTFIAYTFQIGLSAIHPCF